VAETPKPVAVVVHHHRTTFLFLHYEEKPTLSFKPLIPTHVVKGGIFALVGYIAPETDYATYLQSDAWREKRKARLFIDDHRCRICDTAKNLDVHHRTYARVFIEDLNDLTTLCRRCHDLYHGIIEGVP